MKHPILESFAFAACLALSAAGSHAQTMSEAQHKLLTENLIEADANADGAFSLSEFEVLIQLNAVDNLGRAPMLARSGRSGMAFARIDTNGDGLLTQAELQAMLQQARG